MHIAIIDFTVSKKCHPCAEWNQDLSGSACTCFFPFVHCKSFGPPSDFNSAAFFDFAEINWLRVLWHSYFISYLSITFYLSLFLCLCVCAMCIILSLTSIHFNLQATVFVLRIKWKKKYSIKLIDCPKCAFLNLFAVFDDIFNALTYWIIPGIIWINFSNDFSSYKIHFGFGRFYRCHLCFFVQPFNQSFEIIHRSFEIISKNMWLKKEPLERQ